jgi:prepilin-type N-terminal cleavage/methylation domain-containing protein
MSRVVREEDGFTLVELLVVCVVMLVVLGATLTALNSFQSNAQTNNRQNDAQQEARRATDELARELRNLASPTNEEPYAIKRAQAQDLIVQSVADVRPAGSLNVRNAQFVRYCYDVPTGKVFRQRFTWTTEEAPGFPAETACPAGTWKTTELVAQDAVNGARPLFTYNSSDVLRITEIHTSLYVDVNPGKTPKETNLSTTVFLRNQNRQPIARFTAVRDGGSIVLNGSDSEDPEERALYYFWHDPAANVADQDDPTLIGTGIVHYYTPATPGSHTIYLVVTDQADLAGTAPPQTVCVPGGTITC